MSTKLFQKVFSFPLWLFFLKKFFEKFQIFLTFLQVRGHEFFQKLLGPFIQNTSLKLTETTRNVVGNVNLDFLGCFE